MKKCQKLIQSDAKITVVSPKVSPQIQKWAVDGRLRLVKREFKDKDINGAKLVIAATQNRGLNWRIFKLGRKKGIWINIVDQPSLCDFISPAVVRRGDIFLSISTGGGQSSSGQIFKPAIEITSWQRMGRPGFHFKETQTSTP